MHNYDRIIVRKIISFIIKINSIYPRKYYYSKSMIGKASDYELDCYVQPVLHDTDFLVESEGSRVVLNIISDNMSLDESWIYLKGYKYFTDYPTLMKESNFQFKLDKMETGSTKVPLLEFDSVTRKVKVWYHNFLQDNGHKAIYIRLGDDFTLIDEIEEVQNKLTENYNRGTGSNVLMDTLNQVIEDGLNIHFTKD